MLQLVNAQDFRRTGQFSLEDILSATSEILKILFHLDNL